MGRSIARAQRQLVFSSTVELLNAAWILSFASFSAVAAVADLGTIARPEGTFCTSLVSISGSSFLSFCRAKKEPACLSGWASGSRMKSLSGLALRVACRAEAAVAVASAFFLVGATTAVQLAGGLAG